jgi:hypothetical protein
LPPHPSGQHLSIAISQPQAASLEASVHHRQNHLRRVSNSGSTISHHSDAHISPVTTWAANNLSEFASRLFDDASAYRNSLFNFYMI